MRKIIIPALAALSVAAFTAPASAETRSVAVVVADLDLTTRSGMDELEKLLDAPAETAARIF